MVCREFNRFFLALVKRKVAARLHVASVVDRAHVVAGVALSGVVNSAGCQTRFPRA